MAKSLGSRILGGLGVAGGVALTGVGVPEVGIPLASVGAAGLASGGGSSSQPAPVPKVSPQKVNQLTGQKVTVNGVTYGVTRAGDYVRLGDAPNSTGTATNITSPTNNTSPSATDISAYNTYQTNANRDLSRLLNAYNTANQSENSAYNIKSNQLQSGFNAAQNTYNNNVTTQNQNLLNQENQIRQGVANSYRSLLDMLGAYGGSGSSVALNWAPTAAQHFLQTQSGLANQNTASNLRSLATTFGDYQNQLEDEKKQALDTHNQNIANNQASYAGVRDQLNEILSNIQSRALDPTTIGSALANIESSIPNTKFVQPSYTGVTPVYNAPALSTFESSTPTPVISLPNNNTSASPIAMLMSQLQQKKNQNANVTLAA